MTFTFTLQTVQATIGKIVTVDGYPHPLTLQEVIAAPDKFRPPELPVGFIAVLTGPASPVLAEGTHAIRIGEAAYSLYIAPIWTPGTPGQAYQIVVN